MKWRTTSNKKEKNFRTVYWSLPQQIKIINRMNDFVCILNKLIDVNSWKKKMKGLGWKRRRIVEWRSRLCYFWNHHKQFAAHGFSGSGDMRSFPLTNRQEKMKSSLRKRNRWKVGVENGVREVKWLRNWWDKIISYFITRYETNLLRN